MTGIYFHIPFCARKCPYCDFYSVPYRRETAEQYVDALVRNLRHYTVEDTVDSVYFGGGTPSLLTASQLETLLGACAKHLRLAPDTEITLELNPSGRREEYLKTIRALGINRLSIGTQSFSDAQLSLLGRTHTAAGGIAAVEAAANAGFGNLSCDLILACPEQSETVLQETLDILTGLPITHVSSYLLQVEADTPLARNTTLLQKLPDDDASTARYLQTVRHLEAHGFAQYEVSSFAKPGFESRHNLKYWQCTPYLGIGAGAHSCYDGKRFFVPKDVQEFCVVPFQTTELLDDAPCSQEERLMLALRTTRGIPRNALRPDAERRLMQLQEAGYLHPGTSETVRLTPEGFAVSNAVIAKLLDYQI